MKADIENNADIERMVNLQYEKLLADSFTKEKFVHLDLKIHLPRVYAFWQMVVFHRPDLYLGNAFEPHLKLGLQKTDFDIWINYLFEAIDSNWEGQNSNKVKEHAVLMAQIFQSKMNII